MVDKKRSQVPDFIESLVYILSLLQIGVKIIQEGNTHIMPRQAVNTTNLRDGRPLFLVPYHVERYHLGRYGQPSHQLVPYFNKYSKAELKRQGLGSTFRFR